MDHLNSKLNVDFVQISDAGIKDENQDTVGARLAEGSALTHKGIAIAIADGVSSSQSAKQASQAAITGFLTDYYATPDTWRTQKSALQVIQSLNRYLWSLSQNSVRQEGFLTTFSALILKGDTAFTFHVGDSRIYRFRQNELEQLTRDHTQKLDKNTNYLSRALGADPSLEVDLLSEELEENDLFILTTDGVHDAIPSREFEKIIEREQSNLDELAARMFDAAINHGSRDNISLQLCKIKTLGKPSQEDAVTALSKLPFPPFLEEGQIINGLTVRKILHESERSQVYLVETKENTPLVMKTPSVNYEEDPAYIERFVMESWVGSRIINSHVVRVIPPPEPRTHLFYLTEYIAGKTLKTLIKERAPFDISDAVEVIEQTIKGLRAFHRKDTLHQDLKPDNIVMGAKGAVIIDFGSCWVAGVEEMAQPFARDTILGTLDYSAPEYRFGGQRGQKSDQFSLAVILYEMLTNKKPYGEKFADAMDLKAFHKLRYIPATKHNPLVPTWLDKALEKSLSIHPNGRYSALSEWLTDLKRPNPNWLAPRDKPLMEKNPVLFWQVLAGIGWGILIVLIILRNSKGA